MSLDKARHERRPGERDRLRIGRHGQLRARTNGFDLVAVHHDRPAFVRRGVDGVPHAVGYEQDRRTGRGRGSTAATAAALCRCERWHNGDGGDYEKTSAHEVVGSGEMWVLRRLARATR